MKTKICVIPIDNRPICYDIVEDTERNAIKQEMETLKTVAKENVERTFKLFSQKRKLIQDSKI